MANLCSPSGRRKTGLSGHSGLRCRHGHCDVLRAGDLSRLYKTIDACRTWRLVFTNPDTDGFWDALQFSSQSFGALIGDPVRGHFPAFFSTDAGDLWQQFDPKALATADKNQSFFAASNSSLLVEPHGDRLYMITGGGTTSLIAIDGYFTSTPKISRTSLDLASGATAGGFSLASRVVVSDLVLVAVGGDYKAPDEARGTATYRIGGRWQAPHTLPNGYRSAVAYYVPAKAWIAVGPNGTDISTDDGRNWRALKPDGGGWSGRRQELECAVTALCCRPKRTDWQA